MFPSFSLVFCVLWLLNVHVNISDESALANPITSSDFSIKKSNWYNDRKHRTRRSPFSTTLLDINPALKLSVSGTPMKEPSTTQKPPSTEKDAHLLNVNLDVDPVVNLLVSKGTTSTQNPLITSTGNPVVINRIPEVPKCGQRIVQHTELITNGMSTKPGDWPWHAALYRIKNTGSTMQYICGGTLLSQTRVLTAAHCVLENEATILPERLSVTLGKYNLAGGDIGAQERNVFDIVVHPDFSRSSLSNDIAIVKLSARVNYSNYIQPICLWSTGNNDKSAIVDSIGTVVGWGFTEQDTLASQLTTATMPIVDDIVCIKSNPNFYSNFITEGTFCAGYRNGTSVCNGDSGGGMYFSQNIGTGQDTWMLRGIVSLSVSRKDKNVCDPNEYTIFTDAAQYRDFIQSNI